MLVLPLAAPRAPARPVPRQSARYFRSGGGHAEASRARRKPAVDADAAMPAADPGPRLPSPPARCSWWQTSAIAFCMQVGWGMWLLPYAFAQLGWLPAVVGLLAAACVSAYVDCVFGRLFLLVPGTCVYADVAGAAFGKTGRRIVAAVVIVQGMAITTVIQLAAASLVQRVAELAGAVLPLWAAGLVVAAAVWVPAQVRSVAGARWLMVPSTCMQLVATALAIAQCVLSNEQHVGLALVAQPFVVPRALCGCAAIIFAYGGQLGFFDVLAAMREPAQWPRAVLLKQCVMTSVYLAVGLTGYWLLGQGAAERELLVLLMGLSPLAWAAIVLVLVAGVASTTMNCIAFVHNLICTCKPAVASLCARLPPWPASRGRPGPRGDDAGGAAGASAAAAAAADEEAGISSTPPGATASHNGGSNDDAFVLVKVLEGESAKHDNTQPDILLWALTSAGYVVIAFLLGTLIPNLGGIVALVTSVFYLLTSVMLPTAFLLKLRGWGLERFELAWCTLLLLIALGLSALGIYASLYVLAHKGG